MIYVDDLVEVINDFIFEQKKEYECFLKELKKYKKGEKKEDPSLEFCYNQNVPLKLYNTKLSKSIYMSMIVNYCFNLVHNLTDQFNQLINASIFSFEGSVEKVTCDKFKDAIKKGISDENIDGFIKKFKAYIDNDEIVHYVKNYDDANKHQFQKIISASYSITSGEFELFSDDFVKNTKNHNGKEIIEKLIGCQKLANQLLRDFDMTIYKMYSNVFY